MFSCVCSGKRTSGSLAKETVVKSEIKGPEIHLFQAQLATKVTEDFIKTTEIPVFLYLIQPFRGFLDFVKAYVKRKTVFLLENGSQHVEARASKKLHLLGRVSGRSSSRAVLGSGCGSSSAVGSSRSGAHGSCGVRAGRVLRARAASSYGQAQSQCQKANFQKIFHDLLLFLRFNKCDYACLYATLKKVTQRGFFLFIFLGYQLPQNGINQWNVQHRSRTRTCLQDWRNMTNRAWISCTAAGSP